MMLRRMLSMLLLAAVFVALPARAVLPENGMYYNPTYQGLGYSIEVQGTTLVMIAFAYDKDTGKPTFYYAAGTITRAKPSRSEIFTPPAPPYEHEYPYQFDGPIYQFTKGPCLTCVWLDWQTAPYAVEAGHVRLRMSDINRITATFTLKDGSTSTTDLWRQGFGRPGYDLGREDGRLLPDMRGEWIFVERGKPETPVRRFRFTEVSAPTPLTDPHDTFYGRAVPLKMRFVDPEADATLTCTRDGCALAQGEETRFLVKFWDIGMDSLLGYKGDTLFPSDREAVQYRTGDLVIGKHMINPTPDAAALPEAK
ncbi:MAG TPA: hypothetical protein VFN09_09990 [Rhodanobacteraceae bacterium]|nr:hypothetical protein [Rhodanobacteraceae bacterium]